MPQDAKDRYESEVKTLAERVESCKAQIHDAEEEVQRLKGELVRTEDAHRAAIALLHFYYPQQPKADFVINGQWLMEVKRTTHKRHKLDDYVPHLTSFLREKPSAHYKDIMAYLEKAMQEPMGEHQVYKALRRIIDNNIAPIQQDPTRKGYFMLKTGTSDVRPAIDESGRQNQNSPVGDETMTA